MKILLVADHPDDARAVEAALTGDGHTVTTCNDRFGGPCRGVAHLDDCPLESSVDLAVVARSPHGRRGIEEMGSVCAARHRVGVVEIDPSVPDDRSIYDLADAAEHEICLGYAKSVDETVRELLVEQPFEVQVGRHDRDVHVKVQLGFAATPVTVSAVADRARAGVRHHDRFAQVIDVSVRQSYC
ncbi:MAG: response regulator [Acidimicrobiales bacterium]